MKLHHIGMVVDDISKYEQKMIYEEKVSEVYDEIQNAQLALYKNYGSSYIELIQPLNDKAFTYLFLQKNGNAFHHFCYEINKVDLEQFARVNKLIKLMDPVPALLFSGQMVAFYYTRNRQVVEFLLHG